MSIEDQSINASESLNAFTDKTGVLLATVTTLNGSIVSIIPNNAKLVLDIETLQGTNAEII